MYADQVVLTNVLRLGLGGVDTPAEALGAAMHAHNGRLVTSASRRHNRTRRGNAREGGVVGTLLPVLSR